MGELLPFEEVYRLHRDRVYRFCVAQLSDRQEAEDVTADVFVAAYGSYERSRPEPDVVHFWLYKIARNKAIDHRRRKRRFTAVLDTLRRTQPSNTDVESIAETHIDFDRALVAMQGLRDRERTLVSLRVGGDLSYAEIGEIVGMNELSASTATRRALKKLADSLEESK